MRRPEECVMPTPSAECFTIGHNIITRSSGEDDEPMMVLLDEVVGEGVCSFRAYIHQQKGGMGIGVTDRVTQMEMHCPEEKHSIGYACDNGIIFFATDDGKYKYYDDGVDIVDGMELLCEVEREKCQVTFTVLEGGQNIHSREVYSPILSDDEREFVPFFTMSAIGDRISWELQ